MRSGGAGTKLQTLFQQHSAAEASLSKQLAIGDKHPGGRRPRCAWQPWTTLEGSLDPRAALALPTTTHREL
jgi:hypothetical protein